MFEYRTDRTEPYAIQAQTRMRHEPKTPWRHLARLRWSYHIHLWNIHKAPSSPIPHQILSHLGSLRSASTWDVSSFPLSWGEGSDVGDGNGQRVEAEGFEQVLGLGVDLGWRIGIGGKGRHVWDVPERMSASVHGVAARVAAALTGPSSLAPPPAVGKRYL